MKSLLDSMLILTKQDRLCHVIHATSDAFYQTWLRQLNVMQHCKIISIGDCGREETRRYFAEHLLGGVPPELRCGGGGEGGRRGNGSGMGKWEKGGGALGLRMKDGRELSFEVLYEAFGGKLAHWADFVADFGEPPSSFFHPLLSTNLTQRTSQ